MEMDHDTGGTSVRGEQINTKWTNRRMVERNGRFARRENVVGCIGAEESVI